MLSICIIINTQTYENALRYMFVNSYGYSCICVCVCMYDCVCAGKILVIRNKLYQSWILVPHTHIQTSK